MNGESLWEPPQCGEPQKRTRIEHIHRNIEDFPESVVPECQDLLKKGLSGESLFARLLIFLSWLLSSCFAAFAVRRAEAAPTFNKRISRSLRIAWTSPPSLSLCVWEPRPCGD